MRSSARSRPMRGRWPTPSARPISPRKCRSARRSNSTRKARSRASARRACRTATSCPRSCCRRTPPRPSRYFRCPNTRRLEIRVAPDLILNVVIAGVLTGLVYGLMALGLSVIFGVVRVVNFAHGEMMTIAMYAATVLFAALKLDPFLAALPVAALFFVFGYALQAGVINPFITRPEHSQFMLLVAIAIIMVNGLLLIFGPDARNVQVDYQLESFEFGKILVDKARLFAAGLAVVAAFLLFGF